MSPFYKHILSYDIDDEFLYSIDPDNSNIGEFETKINSDSEMKRFFGIVNYEIELSYACIPFFHLFPVIFNFNIVNSYDTADLNIKFKHLHLDIDD